MKQSWMAWGVVAVGLVGCGSSPIDRAENASRRIIEVGCNCNPRNAAGDTVSVAECIQSQTAASNFDCTSQVAQRYASDFEVAFDCSADAIEAFVRCLDGLTNRCDSTALQGCAEQYGTANDACPEPTGARAEQFQNELQSTCGNDS